MAHWELKQRRRAMTRELCVAAAVSLGYVAVLYMFGTSVAGPHGEQISDRNDPVIIRLRLKKVVGYCGLVLVVLPAVLGRLGVQDVYYQLNLVLGVDKSWQLDWDLLAVQLCDVLRALVLVSALYVGPLLDSWVTSGSPLEIFRDLWQELRSLEGLRDLVVAPVSEEFIYTACIIVTMGPSASLRTLLLLPPTLFSFAHVHKCYELYVKRVPLAAIAVSTAFQVCYTFLFGVFTNFIFLRTGSLYACCLVHGFCNFMSLPSLKLGEKSRWTLAYRGLLVLGGYMFYRLLWVLTDSPLQIYQF